MRIAKYIFLLVLLITITVSVFVATKDGNYIVTKSKQIDVSKEIVFNYVSDSKNWETINPWKGENTKVKSVQKIGEETILQNIIINEVPAELELTFRDTLSKKTIVTWTTKGKLSFKDKFLSIINRGTHNDFAEKFENGLTTLNTILTTEINSFTIKVDGFVNRDTIFYIQQVVSCKVEELPAKIKKTLPKLNQLLKITNTPENGAPFIVYHSIDSLANKITFSVAIPTKQKVFTSTESDIYTGQTNPFQAVKAT
ncbi:AraC family transcriptional regulator, partial [Flavobacterium sp.]|uniref:AraC family transcriptional regulator n=1 Tax=Flavobacterium sp. TaxID=239 RepID=UPI0038FCB3AC